MQPISVTHYSDPGCPWAYSGLPAISALRWRYGDQLEWRTVTIGLAEDGREYEARGYTARYMVAGLRFARFGMPFALMPRARILGTGRACRAIVAAGLADPHQGYLALRALHFAWFTTTLMLDEDEAIRAALATEPALDADDLVGRLDDADVEETYQRDRAEARTAEGSAAQLQGKTTNSDGLERFTAPTLVFQRGETRLVSGGHQPLEAHDVVVSNLNPELNRSDPPGDPQPLLERFGHGLTTREVSIMLAGTNEDPDDNVATAALVELAADGLAIKEPRGSDGLWFSSDAAARR